MHISEVMQRIQQARAQGTAADLSGIDLRVEQLLDLDLSGANFSGANLSGSEFRACNLAKCNFHRANLSACRLAGSDLSGADMSEALLGGATLSDCKLIGSNLSLADLSGAILQSSDLTGANLAKAILNAANAAGVNLHGARMAGAHLRQTDLVECDFGEGDLSAADMYAARLRQCKLIKCILHKAELPECDLRTSDLSGADLSRANLENANLAGAILAAANLNSANLINADVTLTDMSGADLRNADLTDAHAGERGQPVLRGAVYDNGTEWPEGLDWSQATRAQGRAPGTLSTPQSGEGSSLLSRLRNALAPDRAPRYTLPDRNITIEERQIGDRASGLLLEVYGALKHNRRISPQKKTSLKRQSRQAIDNLVTLLWTLARVRGAKSVLRPESHAAMQALEDRLLAEITQSSHVLEDVLLSVIQLEIKASDRTVDRLLEDLDDSNRRMLDLAEAYDEVKRGKV